MDLQAVLRSTCASEKCDFTWNIEDFSKRDKNLRTPVFEPFKLMPVKFFLELDSTFRIVNRATVRGFSVYLRRCKLDNISKTARIELSAMLKSPKGDLSRLDDSPNLNVRYFLSKTKKVFLGKKLPYDSDSIVLKFHCELFGHMEASTSNTELQQTSSKEKNSSIFTGSKPYLHSSVFSDLEIHIGEDVFNAHRFLLAVRSPIFKAMLEKDWEESGSNSIKIGDVEPEAFKHFLHYLYTGELKHKDYMSVKSLYLVSLKYAVMELVSECHEVFAAQFATNYLYEIMVLSYLNNDAALKERVVNYFVHGFHKFSTSSEWKDIVKRYPAFATEVLKSINSIFTERERFIFN